MLDGPTLKLSELPRNRKIIRVGDVWKVMIVRGNNNNTRLFGRPLGEETMKDRCYD